MTRNAPPKSDIIGRTLLWTSWFLCELWRSSG